jgi:hypothetical protein
MAACHGSGKSNVRRALRGHFERDRAAEGESDEVGPGHVEMIEQGPQRSGETRDGVIVRGRRAVAASRQIRDDHAKSFVECGHLDAQSAPLPPNP